MAKLDFSRYYDMESDRMVLRAVTDEIMYALMELSGQEYMDKYAQQAKAELQAARKRQAAVSGLRGVSPMTVALARARRATRPARR